MRTITNAIDTRPYFFPSVSLEKNRPGTRLRYILLQLLDVYIGDGFPHLFIHLWCNLILCMFPLYCFCWLWRGMRERSPPLPKIAHPSFPRLGKSQASTWLSAMHKSPPEGTAFLITVSPVPGKLTNKLQSPAFIAMSTFIKLWSAWCMNIIKQTGHVRLPNNYGIPATV